MLQHISSRGRSKAAPTPESAKQTGTDLYGEFSRVLKSIVSGADTDTALLDILSNREPISAAPEPEPVPVPVPVPVKEERAQTVVSPQIVVPVEHATQPKETANDSTPTPTEESEESRLSTSVDLNNTTDPNADHQTVVLSGRAGAPVILKGEEKVEAQFSSLPALTPEEEAEIAADLESIDSPESNQTLAPIDPENTEPLKEVGANKRSEPEESMKNLGSQKVEIDQVVAQSEPGVIPTQQSIDAKEPVEATKSLDFSKPVTESYAQVQAQDPSRIPQKLTIDIESLSRASSAVQKVAELKSPQAAQQMVQPRSSSAVAGVGQIEGSKSFQGQASKRVFAPRQMMSSLMNRVEEIAREALKKRDANTLSFRMDPPELGMMRVDVKLKDGALHAKLSPESSHVTALLRERAPELQQILRKLGLDVQSVSVSVSSEFSQESGSFGTPNQSGSFERQSQNLGGGSISDNEYNGGERVATDLAVVNPLDHWVA